MKNNLIDIWKYEIKLLLLHRTKTLTNMETIELEINVFQMTCKLKIDEFEINLSVKNEIPCIRKHVGVFSFETYIPFGGTTYVENDEQIISRHYWEEEYIKVIFKNTYEKLRVKWGVIKDLFWQDYLFGEIDISESISDQEIVEISFHEYYEDDNFKVGNRIVLNNVPCTGKSSIDIIMFIQQNINLFETC